MKSSLDRTSLITIAGLLLAGTVLLAEATRFSDFAPLGSSAGPTADEATPITFGNPTFQQRSLADRNTQLAAGVPNSGVWDMTTVNETGAHKGIPATVGVCPRSWSQLCRECHSEPGAALRPVFRVDFSPVQPHQMLDDGQTKTGAARISGP